MMSHGVEREYYKGNIILIIPNEVSVASIVIIIIVNLSEHE